MHASVIVVYVVLAALTFPARFNSEKKRAHGPCDTRGRRELCA